MRVSAVLAAQLRLCRNRFLRQPCRQRRGAEQRQRRQKRQQQSQRLFCFHKRHAAPSLIHDGDGKYHVRRLYVLAVGRVAGHLCEIGELLASARRDHGKGGGRERHSARAGCDAAVNLQGDGLAAGEAVVAPDLVRSVRDGKSRHLHGAGFGVVCDPRVVCRDHRAVDDVHGQGGGDGDVDRPVLVGNGQRHRYGGGGRACRQRAGGKGKHQRKGEEKRRDGFSFHKACLSAAGAAPAKGAARRCFVVYSLGCWVFLLRCGIPLHDEHHVCHGRAGHGGGQRGDDGGVVDLRGVAGAVTHAGHVAARDGRVDECLGVGVGGVGGLLLPAADGDGKAQLVAVHLFSGEDGLIAEGRELPTGGCGDGNGLHAHRAVGVVDDLAVVGGGHVAVLRHGHRERGGNGDAHGGGGGVAALGAVRGGAEVDGGGAGAAGAVDLRREHGNGQAEAEAERQDECDELGGMLFHRFFSFRLAACKIY